MTARHRRKRVRRSRGPFGMVGYEPAPRASHYVLFALIGIGAAIAFALGISVSARRPKTVFVPAHYETGGEWTDQWGSPVARVEQEVVREDLA